jgi:hypothetical protein
MTSLDRDAYAGSWTTLRHRPAGIKLIGGVHGVASIIVGGCQKKLSAAFDAAGQRETSSGTAKRVMAKFPQAQHF